MEYFQALHKTSEHLILQTIQIELLALLGSCKVKEYTVRP
jgi:hypothetical protein